MAEYRPGYMMSGRYRNAMPGQRYGYQKPEPACEPEKPEVRVKADGYEVAMAYVPWQKWDKTYELDKALACGTLFPELDKKFYYAGGGCR